MPFNQRLSSEVTPRVKSFAAATKAQRREYFRRLRSPAERILRRQLLQGRRGYGADGKPFVARKRPRKDGARGPVLDPHKGASRTFRLLTSVSHDNGITIYWHHGTGSAGGTSWGDVLAAHASGDVPGGTVRDARMSPKSIDELQHEGRRIWRQMVIEANWRKARRSKSTPATPRRQPPVPQVPIRTPTPPVLPWAAKGRA